MFEEHWFAFRVDRARFDLEDGLRQDWLVHERVFGVEHHRSGERHFIATGIPRWRLTWPNASTPEQRSVMLRAYVDRLCAMSHAQPRIGQLVVRAKNS